MVVTSSSSLAVDALEASLVHVIQTLVDLLQLEPRALARNEELETCCAVLLNNLCLYTTTLRDVMRADDRAKALMFYERTRLGAWQVDFFLQGLPAGLAIFGPCATTMTSSDAETLTCRQAMQDRATTIASLHRASITKVEALRAAYGADDLNLTQLPGRVVVFLQRARMVARGLRQAHGTRSFSPCANALCRRLFFVPSSHEVWSWKLRHDDPNVEDACGRYWWNARDEPATVP